MARLAAAALQQLDRCAADRTVEAMLRYQLGELVFGWDARKALRNARKHRVTFEEAATVFVDETARIYDDPDHSAYEARFLLVGHSAAGRLLLVVHVEKGDTIRIISARRANANERRDHQANA